MGSDIITKLAEKYPFITLCIYANEEYVGVIQNRDDYVTTMYDIGDLITAEEKAEFLQLASTWWWESNRSLPINIFLRGDWDKFKNTLRTFTNKDLEIIHGPVCSLLDIAKKKSKRKSITLVRKID